MEALTPADQAAADVLEEVFRQCREDSACSDSKVRKVYQAAVAKKGGKFKSLLGSLGKVSGPAFVLVIWAGASLGPGVVVYLLSTMAGVAPALSGVAGTLFGVMSGVLFGRVISPFDKRWGAKVEQWANIVWNGEDAFSRLQQKIPETLRIANGQIYNMHFSVREFLRSGAKHVKKGNLDSAGMNYALAVLNAHALFAGMHLDYYVTKRIARLYLRELSIRHIPPADRKKIISAAVNYINELEDDEFGEESRVEAQALVEESIEGWLDFGNALPLNTPPNPLTEDVLELEDQDHP